MDRRVIVVGASLGGLRAAEQVRAAGFTGELVVVGEEQHRPYNRPPLSKEALAATVNLDDLVFRHRKSVSDVIWRLGTAVVAADLAARTVTQSDGAVLSFDGLVVATGLRAMRLPLPGAEQSRYVVRTVDDAQALRAHLRPGARLVVAGAGFIGCEVAATARSLGVDVDVVAPEAVPMQRPLGLDLGAELRRRHESHGVRFHLGRVPARFGEREVVLDDGAVLRADVIVEAVGCKPNVAWLAGNGLDLTDGVLCDNHLRVQGDPRVVAVGDVARFPNPLFDEIPRRVEHWNIPTDTAKRAARTLVSELDGRPVDDAPFVPMPAFWSDQYDLRVQSFGSPALGAGDIRVLEGELSGSVVVGYHSAGDLVGVVGVNATSDAMRYRSRVGRATPVEDNRQPACDFGDLVDGKPHRVEVSGRALCLVRLGERVYALEDRCSHADVPLSEGVVVDGLLECWMHGSCFDLATGAVADPPATAPVRTYPTSVEGGTVRVHLGE